MDAESYFINKRLFLEVLFYYFLRGKVPGTLKTQAESEKNRK